MPFLSYGEGYAINFGFQQKNQFVVTDGMRTMFFCFSLLFYGSFAGYGQQPQRVAMTGEDSVKSLIEALPEVKEKDHVYDSLTNRVQNIIIKITPPDEALHMYHVEAGYQGNNRFQPHFYFYVDLPNNMIYIEDLDKGDRTTLDEWRARRRQAGGSK